MTLRTLGVWFDCASETNEIVAINVMNHAILTNRGPGLKGVYGPVSGAPKQSEIRDVFKGRDSSFRGPCFWSRSEGTEGSALN